VIRAESTKGPFVLFLRGLMDWLMEGSVEARSDRFKSLLERLEKLDARVIVVGSYAPQAEKREKPERLGPPGMDPMLVRIQGFDVRFVLTWGV
jgi:hypothetical protein